MDFSNLMNTIGVKLTQVELTPECTVYIKLPSITQHTECTDPYKAIFYCVVDEDGKHIFDSPEQVEAKVDLTVQLKLNAEIGNVFAKSFNVEDVEGK
ncbi:hypothetical protein [Enterobacter sp. CPE_E1241]|uniref:hypothetical protein n=1 Tax=unclassified Enterobacter TaxID=2608935 RepID=UPI0027EA476A|nr:hypothetical protein [Enterobacter roggenkampii]HEG2003216.1 hypothetical protein [Enterobacter asburiae]